MKSIFKKFLCLALVMILSFCASGVIYAEKLLVTADLSMNIIGENMYKFPDGFEAFLKLNASKYALKVRLRDSSMHIGTNLGPRDIPLPVVVQYNVVLEYDEDDALCVPYLSKDWNTRFMRVKEDVAEARGIPAKYSVTFDLPRDVSGVLVWGASRYDDCINVCNCKLSLETVRPVKVPGVLSPTSSVIHPS